MSAPPVPTEYNTYTGIHYPGQDGGIDYDTGFWGDAAGGITLGQNAVPSTAAYMGLQFDLYTLDATSGLPVNPPLFPEPRPFDPVTGTAAEAESFSLSLSSVPGLNVNNGTVIVYIVPEVNPARFSTASPPFSRGEAVQHIAGGFVYVGPDASRQTTTLTYSRLKPFITHPNFRGRIALSIAWGASTGRTIWYSQEGAPTVAEAPELSVRQTPFHTGMMVGGAELKRRARVVHSFKSGFPYLSDEATQDGYTDGIMMHPDDYDPIDPVDQGRGDYVPSPAESVVDDDVTDLEG